MGIQTSKDWWESQAAILNEGSRSSRPHWEGEISAALKMRKLTKRYMAGVIATAMPRTAPFLECHHQQG